jgi:hypothetical protein
MMKIFTQLVANSIVTVGLAIACCSVVRAGEGRAAGAVAIQTNGLGLVTSVSTSIAVGKNDATATSVNNNGNLSTFAVGSSGPIVPGAPGDYTVGLDSDLGTAQTNTLNNPVVRDTPGVTIVP